MASLADAAMALHSTDGKANFQRLTRLLMCGGVRLLREKFDSIHSPAHLPLTLSHPSVKNQLKGVKLSPPEWQCLYPAPGVYGQSRDFDITLIFRLFKTICNLTEPITGWNNLPSSTDHLLEADLVRIKYYRNSIYGHNHSMEITEAEFFNLWTEIREALLRIAASISNAKRDEWEQCIEKFLHDPLTPEAERYVEELQRYKNDMVLKDKMEQMTEAVEQLILKHDLVIRIITESYAERRSVSPGMQDEARPDTCVVPIPQDEPQAEETQGQPSGELRQRTLQYPPEELDIWNVILSFKNSFDLLVQYLRVKLGVTVQGHSIGSLLLTVTCSSLESLEGLWKDYCCGHLNEVVQETLVTAEVLEILCLSEVKLKTVISEDDYKAYKEFLMHKSGLEISTNTDQQHCAEGTGTSEDPATSTTPEDVNLTAASSVSQKKAPVGTHGGQRYFSSGAFSEARSKFPIRVTSSGPLLSTGDPSKHEQKQLRPTPRSFGDVSTKDNIAYEANSGYVLVINNNSFLQRDDVERTGSYDDAKNLVSLFDNFNFTTLVYNSQTKSEMLKLLTETADKDFSRFDCFVCVILCHGSKDGIYGTDDELIKVEAITSLFRRDECPTLKGKPKIFLIQACLDSQQDTAHIESDSDSDPSSSLPAEADFLICFASAPGHQSYLPSRLGSPFISSVVDVFKDYADREHLMDMMLRVNNRVAGFFSKEGLKQMPCQVCMLTRKVFFHPRYPSVYTIV